MSKTPVTMTILLVTWIVFLVAGISLVWQAFAEKSLPGGSKIRNYLNGVKFRFRFLSGLVLIVMVILGAVWLFAS